MARKAGKVSEAEVPSAIDDLAEILSDAKLTVTFSAHCVSGLVGRDTCQCWRCRGVEPEEETPGWARAAELISRGHQAEVVSWLRLEKFRRNCPVCKNGGRDPRCPGCGREAPV